MREFCRVLGVLAVMGLPCAAGAQNPQPAPPAQPHVAVAPPNAAQPPPEQIVPGPGKNLSDTLSQQHGTLHPPAVDPGMNVAAPKNGPDSSSVIAPPGSPGGDHTVVPK